MENIQYELSYTVETESDLYSPLKEGDQDRLSEEIKSTLLTFWGKASRIKQQKQDFTLKIIAKEGTVDITRAEKAFRYWFEELDQEYKARNKFNSRGEIMIFLAGAIFLSVGFAVGKTEDVFLATVLETIGAVALWNLADTLLVVYPAAHMRRRRFRLFAEHFHIVG